MRQNKHTKLEISVDLTQEMRLEAFVTVNTVLYLAVYLPPKFL